MFCLSNLVRVQNSVLFLVVLFWTVKARTLKSSKESHKSKEKLSVKSDVEVVSKLLDVNSFKHHSYEEMLWFMKYFATKYTDIASLYDIGESVQNRKIWVLEISKNPGKHDPGEPEVKLVGGIHGEEAIGKEILLQLIKLLCEKYDKDPELTKLVDNTRIHILPSLNPDGYAMARTKGYNGHGIGHTNAHGVDLNRNFPDQFFPSSSPAQVETEAVEHWIKSHPFVLSASLHAGSLVVTYPYDDSPSGQSVYSATPDDDVFRHLAKTYSVNHPTMHLANPKLNCTSASEHFIDGVTNGAKWFSVPGGMQDYNYVRSNCFEVTIQLGCDKFPDASKISSYWKNNKKSLIKFVNQVHSGIKGFVRDGNDKAIEGASVAVSDRQHPVTSAEFGDYWRLLVPGSYEMAVTCSGYRSQKKVVEVHLDKITEVDFVLKTARDDDEEQGNSQGMNNDDPRESGKRNWAAAAEKRGQQDDSGNDAPKDTKSDFSEVSSNEDDQDRPQSTKLGVRGPASPEEEEDSSFERKDHLADASEALSKNNKNGAQNRPKKKQKLARKKHVGFLNGRNNNSFVGEKVVCHVRGKTESLKGILKWWGYLPTLPKNKENIVAGIELSTPDKLGTDGTFMGKKYFQATPKHGYFVKYKDCKRMN